MIGNPAAARYLTADWPTKMLWTGIEIGDAVHTGQAITGTHLANSPARTVCMAYVGADKWTYPYDLTAI